MFNYQGHYSLCALGMQIILLLNSLLFVKPETHNVDSSTSSSFHRSSFPEGFIFGTASAAYQFEGAATSYGRGQSIWDTFTHSYPERSNMDNGDVATDFYHRYKDDIKLMKEMNMDSFRFSVSWPRIIPNGKINDGVNEEGIQFYKYLIDELLTNGIEPLITIFHWDLPQTLEDEYGGFLSSRIVDDFRDFARLCYKEFGDKVKLWTTFNEPWVYSVAGYDNGKKAAGRCSKWVNNACQDGNSGIEPYIVSHHMLLAHAAAVEEFRKCNKCEENGKIGIVLCPVWFEPHTDSPADKEAAKRALQFTLGWHLDPVTIGDYPEHMKILVGDRLPSFTEEESQMLKNSFDFIGINYYGALYASHLDYVDPEKTRYATDHHTFWTMDGNGTLNSGAQIDSAALIVHPQGIKDILKYIKDHYDNPTIYIAENGYGDFNDGTLPLEKAVKDTTRKEYHQKHLQYLLEAINDYGVDVKGYFAWSLMDNFEWNHGYHVRFGLYYVDFKNDLKRYPKDSAKWFKRFLENRV